ncbi:MAG: response regulator [Ignavibacteriales bacterium]|nr:response regulator [Ignavibacteriales bacterium]
MLKSKLYWRVLANFALLLVILTTMTFLTLRILSQIEQNFSIASADITTLGDIEKVRRYINDVPAAANEYAFTASALAKATYETGWKEFDDALNTLKKDYADSSAIQDIKQIRELYFGWMQNVGDSLILLGDNKNLQKDPKAFQTQLRTLAEIEAQIQYIPNARKIIRDLYSHKIASQPRSIELATSLSSDLGKFIGLVNILLAIFALALGFVLTRSITKPIRLLKNGTQNIMLGKFEPITLNRSDELGDLAGDFNKMSAMLGNNYTRLQAYSELVTTLNSLEHIEDVEKKSLRLLCSHTQASVGALYIVNRESNMLELVSGYALKSKGETIKSFAIGEGIPGQCAAQGKILEIDDIPASTGFSVDTGLIELLPQYIMAVPIMFQERILGVLVLGSMKKFGDLEKEIVNNSVPQLSVAITNAMNDDATRKLSLEIAKRNEELNSKNSELEKAYRVKSDFLSSMSHELRTPLNSIIGFSSVLLGPNGDPLTADQRMALEKVLKNGKHLLQLINDILDLSKLESGRMTLSVESEDIPSVVSNCMLIVEPLIQQKKLSLVQDIQQNLPTLTTDIVKVRQILVNLLSNASKFTEKGEILVNVQQQGDMVSFAIKDSGIGIEKKNFDLVFEEFKQVDSSNTRKYKGTGLGLPISRKLARMLGGDLTVDSEYGHGSTFILTIPPTLPQQQQQAAGGKTDLKPQTIPPPPRTAPSMAAIKETLQKQGDKPQGVQILCIDDDPDVIEILRKYLVPEGYSVTGALSGEEGVEAAAKIKPALITLDIMMPRKDGWQVLRELKQNPDTMDIPVIIHSIVENKPLAMSLGAVDVMTKPTEPKRLLSLVKRYYQSNDQFILLVDDHEDFALAFKDLLKRDGFNVRIATGGKEALKILDESLPSLILLDLIMPGMDGFQVVRELQQKEQWKKIPVVILSGKELSEDEQRQLNAHIADYFKKDSFSTAEMTNTIKRILNATH